MQINIKSMLQGIFKQREPRRFNYKARYYNRENEDIRREKILDGEKNTEVNFGDRFRRKVDENRKTRDKSMKKIIVFLAILALLLYLVSRL